MNNDMIEIINLKDLCLLIDKYIELKKMSFVYSKDVIDSIEKIIIYSVVYFTPPSININIK